MQAAYAGIDSSSSGVGWPTVARRVICDFRNAPPQNPGVEPALEARREDCDPEGVAVNGLRRAASVCPGLGAGTSASQEGVAGAERRRPGILSREAARERAPRAAWRNRLASPNPCGLCGTPAASACRPTRSGVDWTHEYPLDTRAETIRPAPAEAEKARLPRPTRGPSDPEGGTRLPSATSEPLESRPTPNRPGSGRILELPGRWRAGDSAQGREPCPNVSETRLIESRDGVGLGPVWGRGAAGVRRAWAGGAEGGGGGVSRSQRAARTATTAS